MMVENLSGSTVNGYELRQLVGYGGMGAVYCAHQTELGRDVAIKIILPQYADHPDFVRRFTTEAQLIARLEHPHIIPLYDYWREPGRAFLVMRWLQRGNLQHELDRGNVDIPIAARAFVQIADALSFAHEHGVVHRDLKPSNILLDEQNNAYLTDFGIAKDLYSELSATQDGELMGTFAYMSPEQFIDKSVSRQSDVYSLGILLYELLAGRHPFGKELSPSMLMHKQINESLPDIRTQKSNLSEAINNVIQTATAKSPRDRYPDVTTFVASFRLAASQSDTTIREAVSDLYDDSATIYGSHFENPYKGLQAFQETDNGHFFGRETLTAQLLQRMGESGTFSRFLAVVGPSGSGKSSVVKAGLIPALRQGRLNGSENWYIADIRPGSKPFEELEILLLRIAINPPESLLHQLSENERGLLRAVRRALPPDGQLMLIIDQFEELFTLVNDVEERNQFLDSLYTAVTDPQSPLHLIITLRADYYDQPLLHPRFSQLLSARTQVVIPLTPAEIERAIINPARQVGITLEPGLAAAIIADVSGRPSILPLLQYALTEMFEQHDGRIITLQDYHKIGGVLGALARRADEVYSGLDPSGKEAARQVFMRLVSLDGEAENTRRRVMREELMGISEGKTAIQNVLEVLGQARLISFDYHPETRRPTVEIAHEAILNEWSQLRTWLDVGLTDIRMQRILSNATLDWNQSGQDPSFLLRGSRLDQFAAWADESKISLVPDEREFLNASIEHRRHQQDAELKRQANEVRLEKRSRTVLRVLAAVFLVATLISVALAGIAFNQSSAASANAATATVAQGQAIIQYATAERRADESRSLALAIGAEQAISLGQPDEAITLALAANDLENPPPEAQRALVDSADFSWIRKRFSGHSGNVWSVAYSPDGRTALSGGADLKVIHWDVKTGEILHTFEGHTADVYAVAFSPDSKLALSGAADKTLILWDLTSGTLIRRFTGHTLDIVTVRFSPDGKTALSASADDTLILWDISSGEAIRRFEGHTGDVWGVAFTPDGRQAVSGGVDKLVIVWDVETGKIIRTLEGHSDVISSVAITPDGKKVLSGSWDSTLILWEIETGSLIRTLTGHTSLVWSVALSSDGRTAISGADDTMVILWDIETGTILRRMEGHQQGVFNIAFSPDGLSALSVSDETTPILWDTTSGNIIYRFTGHTFDVRLVTFSPDGLYALSGSDDMSLVLWDASNGSKIQTFEGHTGHVHSGAFSPDGKTILSGASDKLVILWDMLTGKQIRVFEGHTGAVEAVSISPDGNLALSASDDQTMILWDISTGKKVRVFEGHTAPITSVTFSIDGKTALSGSGDKTILLWDVVTGNILRRFQGHTADVTSVAFSPDGMFILSGSRDTTMLLWDVATGNIRRRFQGHTADVTSVAFSPDGMFILSGSRDTTMLLWDVATGNILRRFQGHSSQVFSIAFNPDGQTALSGSDDSTMILWRIQTYNGGVQTWLRQNRFINPLTCEQRSLYHLEPLCGED